MKRLLAILILIFTLQTPSQADDIRDLEVEGMSIGDSALDFFSEKKIKKAGKNGFIYPNKKYYSATFYNEPIFETYDEIQFHLKNKDKKYMINSISGHIIYEGNIDKCYAEMKKITSEIKSLFKSSTIDNAGTNKHPADKSGKSSVKSIYIDLDSGEYVSVECFDWSKEKKFTDTLTIAIDTKEFASWLTNEASK